MSATPASAGESRRNFARAEGLWYMRHAGVLARWPILAEGWAQRVEDRRLAAEAPGRGTGADAAAPGGSGAADGRADRRGLAGRHLEGDGGQEAQGGTGDGQAAAQAH